MTEKKEFWRWKEYRWHDENMNAKDADIISAGVDIGSVSSQAVIMLDGKLYAFSNQRTGFDSPESANQAINWAMEGTGMTLDDVHYTVGTGYGRVNVPFADKAITGIACHARGGNFMYGSTVRTILDMGGQDCKAIRSDDADVGAVTFRRCVVVFDEQRNFAPTFDEQQRCQVDADSVILAIGQASRGDLPAEVDGVFVAGDVASGPGSGGSVADAVASGRAAAERIDRHWGGDGQVSVRLVDQTPPSGWIGRQDGFVPRARVPSPCAAPEQRRTGFHLIEETYARDDAVAEAKRCLQCDLRLMISEPTLPPETWLTFERDHVERVPAVDGVFVLAGADKIPLLIKGADNLQAALLERLESESEARLFRREEDRMYTKRESELIEQHLQQYGELAGGGDEELDDLF